MGWGPKEKEKPQGYPLGLVGWGKIFAAFPLP
jgi:hypothetical protein